MAAAPEVGSGMKTLALLLLARASLPRRPTFYLTIAGLGGEPDYTQRFKMWADDIDGSLKKAGGDSNVTTLRRPHPRPDPRALRRTRQAGQAHRFPGRHADRPRHLRRPGLQVQHPRPRHHRRRTGGAAGQGPGPAPARREYDQLQRRLDRAAATSQAHRDHRHQDRHPRRTPPTSRATSPKPCANPPPTPTRTNPITALEAFRYAQKKTDRVLRHTEAPRHRAFRDRRHR